jgi:hypothetical protein
VTINKPPDWSSGQWIALYGFSLASALSWGAFLLARLDHDMKLLALGAVISTTSNLMGTASAILVGKPNPSTSGNHDLSSLPDGSITTDSTTVQLPPIEPDSIPKS